MTYAVTGSTGGFGGGAIRIMLKRGIPADSIIAIARNPAKGESLSAMGIQLRMADYNDKDALKSALEGVDRLLMVSGSEIGKRVAHHRNVIEAAAAAEVGRIVYTSLTNAADSTNPLAPEHRETEALLSASGIDHTILRNNWYTDNYIGDIAGARQTGVFAAAVNTGKVGSALKSEYAEAAVNALLDDIHTGKIYELGGELWSYQEFARTLSLVLNRPVEFKRITEEEKKNVLIAAGLPAEMAAFFAGLDTSIENGTLARKSEDLEKLLGRKPATLQESLRILAG